VDIVLHGALAAPEESIVIPQARAMSLLDLIDAIHPGVAIETIGLRPGEKLHESLLSQYEAPKAECADDYVYLYPTQAPRGELTEAMTSDKAPRMEYADMVEAIERAQTI
jgi:FlaA1/EpsC-like NDP-sugar epimerase